MPKQTLIFSLSEEKIEQILLKYSHYIRLFHGEQAIHGYDRTRKKAIEYCKEGDGGSYQGDSSGDVVWQIKVSHA